MKIGYVTNYYVPELGMNTYFLCRELGRLGVDITLFASGKYGKKKPLEQLKNVEQPFGVVKVPTRFNLGNMPIYKGLHELLEPYDFDIIQTEDSYQLYSFTAMKFAKEKNIPLVLRHDLFQAPPQPYKMVFRILEKLRGKRVTRAAKVAVVPMKEAGDYLRRLNPGLDIRFIPYGVDIKQVEVPREHNSILTVARLVETKGLFDLFKALEIVKGKTAFSLTLIGRGPLESALKALAREQELNVRFVPFVPHDKLAEYYCRASLFVLPSYEEAPGLSVMEALQCGLPVVANDIPGVRDSVRNGIDGILVPPKNVKALARAILQGFDLHPPTPRDFSWAPIGLQMKSIYQELLASSQEPNIHSPKNDLH